MRNGALKSTKCFAFSYLRDDRDYLNIVRNIFEKYENVNMRDFTKEC